MTRLILFVVGFALALRAVEVDSVALSAVALILVVISISTSRHDDEQ